MKTFSISFYVLIMELGDYMTYDELLEEADTLGLIVKDKHLLANDGRIKGNKIAIKKELNSVEKNCVLAEELGHYYTTSGTIIDMTNESNLKQETRARLWSYNKLIGIRGIISAYEAGCKNKYEMAEYLNVTEEFLEEAIKKYTSKYGAFAELDNYIIYFMPNLGVMKLI